METPFGWHELNADEARRVLDRLRSFETMTWKQIIVDAGHHNHLVPVADLCRQAQACPEVSDVDEVMSLRVTQASRIFGIMSGSVCRLLWWDPEHEVYPMNIANN